MLPVNEIAPIAVPRTIDVDSPAPIASPARGGAAHSVEERDHLRHRGHLHGSGEVDPYRGTDQRSNRDHPERNDLTIQQSNTERHGHSNCGEAVASARGRGRAQLLEPENEKNRRNDVAECYHRFADIKHSFSGPLSSARPSLAS
jgi:hypothetical protein